MLLSAWREYGDETEKRNSYRRLYIYTLAILLANYAEHMAMSTMMEKRFMNVQGSDLLGGLRITDDGLVLITVD